ncbi:hypothetical protein RHSIM_Rhsim13G0046500 [Rhododendron simsii]|uniref:Uncharacterized protein n=1 Tax=Rhododendron simsii TaxID=118357 RepID=A0A834FY08_RHOSS|nr:hypothetical protein RHSIM_Rhsim13G0046500 [Rhododendron simsii]
MLRKGFLSCPSRGNRPLSKEEKGEDSSPKQGNRPLSKDENGKGSSPRPLYMEEKGKGSSPRPLYMEDKGKGSSPEQGKQPLSKEEKGGDSCPKLGDRPLSNKGKGKASGSKLGNGPLSKKGKGKNWARNVNVGKGKWKGNPTSRSPWDELSRMDPFERAMILESLDDDPPWDDFCSKRAMILESLGDDPPWDDFCSKRAMMLESFDDDSPWDDFCSLDFIERAFFLGNQPLSKKEKGKGSSSKQGNRPVSKKKKGKDSAHTAGKGKSKGNRRSWSLRELNARMDPFERAMVLKSLEKFCYLDASERALYLESLDESEINDIYRALFLEPSYDESEFGSVGGELSPDTKDRIGREFDRNFERDIEKAIAEKSKNGLDLLDVEIFKSMLGKPNWIDTDDFKQQFSDVVEDGNEDGGRRLDMLCYLQSKYDAEETKSVDAHSHTKVKSSGSSGKDYLRGELGMMGACFIPVVEHDEGMVMDNNTGLQDIRSSQLHFNSKERYAKAKTKTQLLRPDPMDEAKSTMNVGKTLGVDMLGQEDFWVKRFAKMIVKERAEYDAPRKD